MKKTPLRLKLKQLKWTANMMALTLAIEAASIPVRGGDLPFICLNLMANASSKDPAAEKAQRDKDNKQSEEEGKIRKAQTTKARPLNIDEEKLAYYKTHPEEVKAWLEDIKIRKDSGRVTDVEDMTAYALTSEKAETILRTLIERNNISIRYGSAFELFHLSELQKYQATVKRSSYFPLWFWKMFKGSKYPRAFTITLQRQVPVREKDDLSITGPLNTRYAKYSDSIGLSLFTALDGSDPQFTRRDVKRKGAAILAFGRAAWVDGRVKLNYESNIEYERADQMLKEIIVRSYRTSLEIANSPEDVAVAVKYPALLNNLVLDLNQKEILNSSDPESYVDRIVKQTAQREIPQSFLNSLKTLSYTGIIYIIWVFGKTIYFGFFPSGAGSSINGKNMTDNTACDPTPSSTDFQDVMTDLPGMKSLSPSLDVFIAPDQRPGFVGKPNPCDPDGTVATALKNPDTESNSSQMASLMKQIRGRYNYNINAVPNNPSDCAMYYGWYSHCRQAH